MSTQNSNPNPNADRIASLKAEYEELDTELDRAMNHSGSPVAEGNLRGRMNKIRAEITALGGQL